MRHVYSDSYLNFWGEVYVACRLHQARVEFEEFLENPQTWLARLGIEDALEVMARGFLPLMPAQAQVRREVLVGDQMDHAVPVRPPAGFPLPAAG